jgi:epoxide hydrolase-like predicted phosphatase
VGSLFKSKRSIKTIFFDIGGVVVKAPMLDYLKYGSEIFGCEPRTLEDATAQVLPDLETGRINNDEFWDRVSRILAENGQGKVIPAWRFKGFWEGILTDSLQVDHEMITLVRRLKAHVRVAALTNVIKEHAKILQKLDVYQHFNPVILSCKIGLRKPDLAIYEKAAELAKTPMERCLLVDDCLENLQAAQKAGYRVLQFTDISDLKRALYGLGLIDNV